MNNKENIYKIKRVKNVKDSNYDEESYRKAMKDSRIEELLKSGTFYCEFGHPPRDCGIVRYQSIDLQNICGRIIEVADDNITIQLTGPYGDTLKELLDQNIDSCRAFTRALGIVKENKMIIGRIITFDIAKLEW